MRERLDSTEELRERSHHPRQRELGYQNKEQLQRILKSYEIGLAKGQRAAEIIEGLIERLCREKMARWD